MATVVSSNPNGSDVDTLNIPWTTPFRIVSSNNSYATVGLGFTPPESTNDLCGQFPFSGTPVPSGATIDGVQVDVELKADVALRALNVRAYLTFDGATASGSVLGGGGFLVSTTEGYVTLGGPTDTGGLTLTDTDINSDIFGLMLAFTNVGAGGVNISVDHMIMTVYYTAVSGVRGLAIAHCGI